jgi:hypothetical protein
VDLFQIVACRPDHSRGLYCLRQLDDSLMNSGDNQTWVSQVYWGWISKGQLLTIPMTAVRFLGLI